MAPNAEGIMDTMINNVKELWRKFEGKQDGWTHASCTGLCSDVPLCLYGCCCPCLLAKDLAEHHKPGTGCAACCCVCCCQFCSIFAFRMGNRENTRTQNNIIVKDDKLNDFFSTSCFPCAMIQEKKQNDVGGKSAPAQEKMEG